LNKSTPFLLHPAIWILRLAKRSWFKVPLFPREGFRVSYLIKSLFNHIGNRSQKKESVSIHSNSWKSVFNLNSIIGNRLIQNKTRFLLINLNSSYNPSLEKRRICYQQIFWLINVNETYFNLQGIIFFIIKPLRGFYF